MVAGRFNPLVVPVDHWRRLVRYDANKPAITSRASLILLPLVLGGLSYRLDWSIEVTGDVVAALGLLAGVFLSAFGIILTLRLSRESGSRGVVSRNMNASLDESAMALLAAALFAGIAAVFFTVVSATGANEMNRVVSAVAIWLSSYVVLYFLLSIGRLYVAYTNAFPAPWSVREMTRGADAGDGEPVVAPRRGGRPTRGADAGSDEQEIATGERPRRTA